MKIKNFFKIFIPILAIVLLCIALKIKNSVEDNSKLIIQSIPKVYSDTLKTPNANNGVKKTIKNHNSGLQLLPVPNTNTPIVLTPLSSNKQ